MTIYEIKRRTAETEPYFFKRSVLKVFGQTLRSFHVYKLRNGKYEIVALITAGGKIWGRTARIFDPETNELEG